MSDKKITLNFDPLVHYVKGLSWDMLFAYGVVIGGIVLVIVGLLM